MKKLFLTLSLLVSSVAVADADAPPVPNLKFVKEYKMRNATMDVYQNIKSHNCYIHYSGYDGSFSQVDCKDFGVLTKEERDAMKKEADRKEYERLKAQFQ